MPPEDLPGIDLERVHGRDVEVQFNGATWTEWESISIKPVGGKFNKNAAGALFEQKTKGRVDATGTLKFIMGGNRIPATLPKIHDEITGLKFELESGEDLLPADLSVSAKYGKCRVMSTPFELQDEPGVITIEIEWGFVD